MRKTIIISVAALSLFCACEKSASNPESLEFPEQQLNSEAVLFYNTLSDIIKATTVKTCMTKSAVEAEFNHTAEFYLENEDDYPVQAKLATIDIETEDGTIVSFFDLPENEQLDFLDYYSNDQAMRLSKKIELIPPIEEYVAAQNEVVLEALEEACCITKSGIIEINNPQSLFATITKKMDEMSSNFEYDGNMAGTKGIAYSFGSYEVEFEKARSLMAGEAKRGDIIVALPTHNYPRSLIDFGNKRYMVGHSEIFTNDITISTKKSDICSIGAWTDDGVSKQPFSNWCWRSYVVGVCSYKIKWKWRGLKSWFYPEQTPVSNPSLLATWAEKYEGHDYVRWYEFATPKWVAPDRFTCTSLVWWCAKKAYNEKISPWYSTLVTPSDVLCDNNTYLKVTVE